MPKFPLKYKPGTPLTVFWRDIISDDEGWFYGKHGGYDPETSIRQSHCVTLGFFVVEKENTLFLARTWRLMDGTCEGVMGFPHGIIRKIVRG